MVNPYFQPYARPVLPENPPVPSVGEWMLTLLVTAIPLIGFIMLFVWAFGDGNPNRKNWARASLLWTAIFLGLIIAIAIFGAVSASIPGREY
ncbi:MAG: hypothetical protein LBT97_14095 [Planctomycetota bacterium]|nr:hypothetical protein [Planctomycetota bacterium]